LDAAEDFDLRQAESARKREEKAQRLAILKEDRDARLAAQMANPRRSTRETRDSGATGMGGARGGSGQGGRGLPEKCACEKAKDVFRSIMDTADAGDVKGAKKELKHVQRDLRLTKQFVKAL